MSEIINQISIKDLLERHGEELALSWVAGQKGKEKVIVPEEGERQLTQIAEDGLDDLQDAAATSTSQVTGKSLVGYLNLIHPHQIQILGGGRAEVYRRTARYNQA